MVLVLLAKIEDYVPQENDVFACTIGTPSVKRKLIEILTSKGAIFVNIIHPSALIMSDLSVYAGLVIAPFSYISNNVILANYVLINVAATLGHDVNVGEYTSICAHCDLTGHVKVGKEVFVGSSACVIPGKVIGDNAVIGAGSAVMRNVPAGMTVVGVPAKRLS